MPLLIRMAVTKTVQLHDEARFFAKEIKIVNSFRMLTSEFVAGETPVTQPAPHKLFRPSFLFAECPGVFDIGHDEKVKETDQK